MGALTDARILIADDEPANVRLLQRLLDQAGYKNVRVTTDARQVRTLYEEVQPDLILLDLMMPHLDGVAVMKELPIPEGEYVPVLILTADVTAEAKQRALTAGAKDFLTKPFDRIEVLLRIRNLLDTRFLYRELERQNRSLEQIVAERTQRLLQSEKVATMGSLLAGVAHELNNPLAILAGQAYLLHEATQDSTVVKRTEKILAASERCTRIVRNFLALARQRPPERSDVLLNQVVQGAVELLAYELRTSNVEVILDLATDLPILCGDPHQLHQVLVNLVANAHHAMRHAPSPRRIAIRTRAARERNFVQLEVADTGPGIPTEVQAKIFEPFFTTKPPGEGTGLGLSLCRGIIEEHDGTIAVDSHPGRGSTFVIELPVLARPLTAGRASDVEARPPLGPKTILVADDEPDMAATLAEALEHDGHRVDIAADGARALEMLQRKAYDLILTDTKMPVLDGLSFYREIERRFPALCRRVIFVTGDVLDREKQAFLDSTGLSCVMKPFDVSEVRGLVHRVLATAHS